MLRQFKASNRWWSFLWGNGHTLKTDPTKRGWRAAPSKKGSDVLIVGRRGVPGCFSVMCLSDCLDVATYDELTPKELAQQLDGGTAVADAYYQVSNVSGWALPFIKEVENFHDHGWCSRCGATLGVNGYDFEQLFFRCCCS